MWSNRIILGTSPFFAFSLSLSHTIWMDVYRILHPTNITLPKTKDLRTTHTFIKLHHPKKTHSMKWSDWMSTTCKVDKNYKTKTNELCIVFVCVDACRCLRVLHSFFHFLFYDFTSVLCTFCCLLSILRHRPKHNVNKFHKLSSY